MKYFLNLILLIFVITGAKGQETTGNIAGKLTDKEYNNEPLSFANVILVGENKGTTTDMDGLYNIGNLEPGVYTIEFSYVGYETITIPDVKVEAGKVTEISTAMGATAATLDEVTITTVARRDSEVALLLEQKDAVNIKQSIGAEELSRKGVGDAEAAVTKISGITKSSSTKNVFVRGLGDRYNSTTLNGLPLPSEDPEYKNIALDFFTTDIIESIGVNKVFNSSIYGDVGGANIDVISKEMTSRSLAEISFSSGLNFNVQGIEFLTPNGANSIGTGIENQAPITDIRQYSFQDGWAPESFSTPVNFSGAAKLGKKFDLGDNSLSAFFTLSASNDFQYREGRIAEFNSAGNSPTDQSLEEYYYSSTQIAMLNLKYRFGDNNYIALNNGLIRKINHSLGEFLGENNSISDDLEDEDFIRRQQTNKNNLYINQILTHFELTEKIDLNISGSYNFIRGSEPDRRTSSFIRRSEEDNEDFFRVAAGSAGLNHRFYSELEENDISTNASATYMFDKENDSKNSITAGADFRNTERTFTFRQFNFQFVGQDPVDINNPDTLFNQENLDAGIFEMLTDRGRDNDIVLDPFFYEGTRDIIAGYINGNYEISEKLIASGGVRIENISQQVDWDTNLTSSVVNPNIDPAVVEENYILPSLSFRYAFNENSILRLASSLSYTMPQFKEVAPFQYEDVNFTSVGNPFLIPSDVFNLDLKYDYFFSSGELLSVAGFYKSINNPINRVLINSAGNNLSYVNFDGQATVAGAEIELRKKVYSLDSDSEESGNKELFFGFNFSYLYTNQPLNDTDRDEYTVRPTNSEDQLQGASPIIANADLTYNYVVDNFKITSSIVVNYFSDRIYSIGTAGNNNFVEKSRVMLDFINNIAINKNLSFSVNVRNIINPDFEIYQEVEGEDRPVETFKQGINASVGFSYKF